MPRGVHKNPFLGWNPPAGDSAWAREEAGRRGVKLSTILTEALAEYRAKHSGAHRAEPVSPSPAIRQAPKNRKCEHRVAAGTYCKPCGKIKEG